MCTSPLKTIFLGYKENGKQALYFCRSEAEYNNATEERKMLLPCKQCVECRLSHSKEWATRCMLEAKEYEHNYFITLTYDDEHLPTNINKLTGEIVPTLKPEHMRKFRKDLQRFYKYHYNHDGIRFYECGEYGTENGRPHYHAIMFNLPIPDKKFICKTNTGGTLYISEMLSKIWKKGIVGVGEVTWESCAYVARYIMKKVGDKSNTELYDAMQDFSISKKQGVDLLGRIPEFVNMSTHPGIARNYFEENKDKIYETDEIILPGKNGTPRVVKPSTYYDNLFDIDNHEVMQAIKEQRKQVAIESMKEQLSKTTLNEDEYLKVRERKKENQLKHLPRKLVELR